VEAQKRLDDDRLQSVAVPLATAGRLHGAGFRVVGQAAEAVRERRPHPLAVGVGVLRRVDGCETVAAPGSVSLGAGEKGTGHLVGDIEVPVEGRGESVHSVRVVSRRPGKSVDRRWSRSRQPSSVERPGLDVPEVGVPAAEFHTWDCRPR